MPNKPIVCTDACRGTRIGLVPVWTGAPVSRRKAQISSLVSKSRSKPAFEVLTYSVRPFTARPPGCPGYPNVANT